MEDDCRSWQNTTVIQNTKKKSSSVWKKKKKSNTKVNEMLASISLWRIQIAKPFFPKVLLCHINAMGIWATCSLYHLFIIYRLSIQICKMTPDDGGNLQLCKMDKNIYMPVNLNLVSCQNIKLVSSQAYVGHFLWNFSILM